MPNRSDWADIGLLLGTAGSIAALFTGVRTSYLIEMIRLLVQRGIDVVAKWGDPITAEEIEQWTKNAQRRAKLLAPASPTGLPQQAGRKKE